MKIGNSIREVENGIIMEMCALLKSCGIMEDVILHPI